MFLKPNPNSDRRLLLTASIPFLLLVIAVPVSQSLFPALQQSGLNTPTDFQGRLFQDEGQSSFAASETETRERVRAAHRMAAEDVVRRIEVESGRKGGTVRMTPLDFKRLRNALR